MSKNEYLCPRCDTTSLFPIQPETPCERCGFPLQRQEMLARIQQQRGQLTEIVTVTAFDSEQPPRPASFDDVMGLFADNLERLLPMIDDQERDSLVFNLDHTYFIFNFGLRDQWRLPPAHRIN